jgi:hypothetical protein
MTGIAEKWQQEAVVNHPFRRMSLERLEPRLQMPAQNLRNYFVERHMRQMQTTPVEGSDGMNGYHR